MKAAGHTMSYGQNAFAYISMACTIKKKMDASREEIDEMKKRMLNAQSYDELIDMYNKECEGISQIPVNKKS